MSQKQKLQVLLENLKHSFNDLAQKIKDLENEIEATSFTAQADGDGEGGNNPDNPPSLP